MLRYTYLYENGMFTNIVRKGKCLRSRVGKEKRVAIIKCLIDV
jgi:hypothetical protein